MLTLDQVSVRFGRLQALQSVSLSLGPGARHALIGPNGAGKTSLVNIISGQLSPASGRIYFAGQEITRMGVAQRAQRGIARSFQINQLFMHMTPLETLAVAINERKGIGGQWWRSRSYNRATMEEGLAMLQQFNLAAQAHTPVVHLAYGEQRLLEIAIALVMRPRLLLLDEPAAGLPEEQSVAMLALLSRLSEELAILLIEHDMSLVFQFAQTLSVLAQGRVIAQGDKAAIQANPQVRTAYLGDP